MLHELAVLPVFLSLMKAILNYGDEVLIFELRGGVERYMVKVWFLMGCFNSGL